MIYELTEKILTSKAALEGERKQVTVLIADLKGSTELLADRHPEEARTRTLTNCTVRARDRIWAAYDPHHEFIFLEAICREHAGGQENACDDQLSPETSVAKQSAVAVRCQNVASQTQEVLPTGERSR